MSEAGKKGGLSRRDFLKVSVGGIGGAISAWVLGRPEDVKAPGKLDWYQELAKRDLGEIWSGWGVKVRGNMEKFIPISWMDAKGNKGEFDLEEMLKINQVAMREKTTQVVEVTRVETRPREYLSPKITKERLTELPENIVSQKELKQRGVEIIGSEKTDLHLTDEVFKSGGLLEGYTSGTDKGLLIMLVDSPELMVEGFADKRYEKHRDLIEKNFSKEIDPVEVREKVIDRIREELEVTKQSVNRQFFEMELKAWEGLSDKEIIELGIDTSGRVAGYHLPQGHEKGLKDKAVIFLPVGRRPRELSNLSLITTEIEDEFMTNIFLLDIANRLPHLEERRGLLAEQSEPAVDEFETLADKASELGKLDALVKTEDRTPGFRLLHELVHDWVDREVKDVVVYSNEPGVDEKVLEVIKGNKPQTVMVEKETNLIILT